MPRWMAASRTALLALSMATSLIATAAKTDAIKGVRVEGGARSSTAKPETITYRMTVLDSPKNDTELYNTTSGSVIIVGRNAKMRSKFFQGDPTLTNAESRTSGVRKAKIINDADTDSSATVTSGRSRGDSVPESRIVNDPQGFFPIKGFIPIIGVPERKPHRQGGEHFVPSDFFSTGKNGPNRNGPPGVEYSPEAPPSMPSPQQPTYYPRKPQAPPNGLPPIVRPEFHPPRRSYDGDGDKSDHQLGPFRQQQVQRPEESRGHFGSGNALGTSYVSSADLPAEEPVDLGQECVCVPFYLCKNGYVASPRNDHAVPGGSPGGSDLVIPIDERSNHDAGAGSDASSRGPGSNESHPQVESRMKRELTNESASVLDAPPAYATDIMQRMLGVSFAHCGVLRTCCKLPPRAPPFLPGGGPGAEVLAQLFSKKAFSPPLPPHKRPLGASFAGGLPFRKPIRRPQVPIDATLPFPSMVAAQHFPAQHFPAPSVGVLGPTFPGPPGTSSYPTCGARNAFGIHGRVKNLHYPESGADFAEFPWHAGIMKKLAPQESLYVCGAALVASQWVATAAHCLKNLRPQDIKIRLGEWDVNRDDEFYAHVEKQAAQVVIHPEFFPGNLNNDLALVRLDSPVDLNLPHIGAACLPEPRESFEGHRCWVTGWGKDAFGNQGEYQNILKKVDVPVVSHDDCQERLKRTRLGPYYQLHPGFVCAGGEPGKDACTGDGGSPLVCEYNGSWKAVGLVSWGIGCGQPGVPGVYVNLAQYRRWIDTVIAGLG